MIFARWKKARQPGPHCKLSDRLKNDFDLGRGHAMAIWAVFNEWAGVASALEAAKVGTRTK